LWIRSNSIFKQNKTKEYNAKEMDIEDFSRSKSIQFWNLENSILKTAI
jgi:hypothetical protein